MARCPSARLNLLSIPLMVARDRNFVSLKVKCHKFLCLVQLWHCIGTPQANRAICLSSGSAILRSVPSWNPSCVASHRIAPNANAQKFQEHRFQYLGRATFNRVADPLLLHDHKRMLRILHTALSSEGV